MLEWNSCTKFCQKFIYNDHYYFSFYYNISKFLLISSGKYFSPKNNSPIYDHNGSTKDSKIIYINNNTRKEYLSTIVSWSIFKY